MFEFIPYPIRNDISKIVKKTLIGYYVTLLIVWGTFIGVFGTKKGIKKPINNLRALIGLTIINLKF